METSNNIPKFGEELKKNPFSTPDGYFDQLPSLIQNRTAPKSRSKTTTWSVLKPQLGFVVGFVALVLMARGMFTFVDRNINGGKHVITISSANGADTAKNKYAAQASDDEENIDDAVIAYLVDRDVSDVDIVQAIK